MKGFVWLTQRVDELEARLENVEKALGLDTPIEMTMNDIELALGHKVKIVEKRDRE